VFEASFNNLSLIHMILIVRVDRVYPNQTAIQAASCAWPCGKMLDNSVCRNEYKLVVPYTRKHGFLDVFCIKSVYENLPKTSRVRKVCFDLVPASGQCKEAVLNALSAWLGAAPGGVLRVQSVKYVSSGELRAFDPKIDELVCCKEKPQLVIKETQKAQ